MASGVGQAVIVGLPARPGPASELPPRVGYVKAPMAGQSAGRRSRSCCFRSRGLYTLLPELILLWETVNGHPETFITFIEVLYFSVRYTLWAHSPCRQQLYFSNIT
jgi:hypothetical protein